ncbi:hypothetical protein Caci_6674 [Catenulispora acidiphila DSM 44928]|uniref:DUF7489 domain-containing protein n=1 Tax=Catenulispora acidiphila (strain DSM 44928 / JCM 14897 / NBRC 102108 / NRRL B-24433 / ID139908) TaxID=479433 RepID=C7Q027_CATAD|nr:hypothetical protein [Catenulispora acidiphila]ACU75520.1 hypothetical protein Caci_6674 [Catenulispora acidiphila DSM 44928]
MFSLRRSHRNEAWEGMVVDKKRGMTDGSSMYFYLKVRVSDGSTKRVRVHRDLWKTLEDGDTVVKAAGAEPVKK